MTYVCKRRADTAAGEAQDAGTVYFAVAFEIVDEEAIEGLKKKGGGPMADGEGGNEDEGEEDTEDGDDGDRKGGAVAQVNADDVD